MNVRIPEDKRERLLSVGLKEFGEQGYENANTNKICEAAQISKGLLFHYFDSKLGFYKWVLEYAANYILESLDELITIEATSLKLYTQKTVELTLKIWNNKPEVIQFYQRVKFDNNHVVADILTQPIYQKALKIFRMHVTKYTDVREDIELELILFLLYKIIEITFDNIFIHHYDITGMKLADIATNDLHAKKNVDQIFDIFLNGVLRRD